LARLPAAGCFGKRKVPVLAAVDVDHGAQTPAASVGGYPGHLRLSLPEDMRAAYSLNRGLKIQGELMVFTVNKQASMKQIGS
jgi:hypothetical protein